MLLLMLKRGQISYQESSQLFFQTLNQSFDFQYLLFLVLLFMSYYTTL